MNQVLPLARRVVDAYGDLDDLAFAYGQGSLVAGFDTAAGLDLVMVWGGSEPPAAELRPVHTLHTGSGIALRFLHRDQFHLDGHQVHVVHVSRREFDRWVDTVRAGQGWEILSNPTPLYSIAGFVYGVLLADVDGSGSAARGQLFEFPAALRKQSHKAVAEELAGAEPELVRAAKRGDGWIVHDRLGGLHRHAMVAWFSAENRYCPYPKWLHRWIMRFALDPQVAAIERCLWAPPASLLNRLEILRRLVDRILTLP